MGLGQMQPGTRSFPLQRVARAEGCCPLVCPLCGCRGFPRLPPPLGSRGAGQNQLSYLPVYPSARDPVSLLFELLDLWVWMGVWQERDSWHRRECGLRSDTCEFRLQPCSGLLWPALPRTLPLGRAEWELPGRVSVRLKRGEAGQHVCSLCLSAVTGSQSSGLQPPGPHRGWKSSPAVPACH